MLITKFLLFFVTQEETFEMLSQVLQIIKGIIFYSLFCISNTL